MMRTMRQNTKVIMLITALAFVGLMVFEWGMDLSGQSSAQFSGGEIGRINGDPVSYEEYIQVYRSLYDQQRQMQDGAITSAQNRQIEDAAWEQVVMDRLISQEIERRGLGVTEAEVREAALYAPPPEFYGNEMFHTDGQFDLNKYQQFLASPAVDDMLLLQLEAYYRQMIPRNKLYRQVVSGAYLPEAELRRRWIDQYEQVRVRFIALDPDAMVPEGGVTVSDDEVAAFYREHRDGFIRPARAEVRIVALDKAPTAADTAAARERADSLRQEIVGGADFAQIARIESADPGSAAQGGDLGTFRKGIMTPAFEEAVWSLRIGQVSQPVQTPFGFHLIEVLSRNGDEAHARHILIPIERTEDSEYALLDQADSLEVVGAATSLEAAAEEFGLAVRTATLMPDLPALTGIGDASEGADWAFEEAEIGDVSPVFEAEQAFYMVELVERVPEGTLSLEEAAPNIRAQLLAQKRMEKARQTGRALVDRIHQSSLDEVASAEGLQIREAGPFARTSFVPGLGQANAAIGTAFGLDEGEVSELVEAQGALYVIELVEKVPADMAEFEEQKDILRAQLAAGLQNQRWSRFLTALREEAKVRDLRNEVLVSADQAGA